MINSSPFFLNDCGIITSLGSNKEKIIYNLLTGSDGIIYQDNLIAHHTIPVGMIETILPNIPQSLSDFNSRNNRFLQVCLEQIATTVEKAISHYGRHRIAVIIGTSTSGIAEGEIAFLEYHKTGKWPHNYHYHIQEASNPSLFVANWFGLTGPTYTIATTCSSSAKVFASARRLIKANIVDAVIIGGADTLCQTALNGFHALELLSSTRCNPFSKNRNGITLGEGAAVFLLSQEESTVELLGIGETSDAYHITAPDPTGLGAYNAMIQAINDAKLTVDMLDYINLHGTASLLNDAMESRAISALQAQHIPCSSTKAMTGHTLGAAGAIEAAFLWLMLTDTYLKSLPPHLWDGIVDSCLPTLNFVTPHTPLSSHNRLAMLSNSFGFGGSNVSLILGRGFT